MASPPPSPNPSEKEALLTNEMESVDFASLLADLESMPHTNINARPIKLSSPKIRTVWDSSDLILMGLGQEGDRKGEVVSWEAASSAPGRVAMNCRKVLFAAIAQNFGRQGLHIMTASMRLVHEGCGTRHFTVGGAGDGLRKALAIASDGVHRRQSRALSEASRAGVSLQTQDKCGLGRLRRATDGPGPGGRQRRRGGELRGWSVRV